MLTGRHVDISEMAQTPSLAPYMGPNADPANFLNKSAFISEDDVIAAAWSTFLRPECLTIWKEALTIAHSAPVANGRRGRKNKPLQLGLTAKLSPAGWRAFVEASQAENQVRVPGMNAKQLRPEIPESRQPVSDLPQSTQDGAPSTPDVREGDQGRACEVFAAGVEHLLFRSGRSQHPESKWETPTIGNPNPNPESITVSSLRAMTLTLSP